MNNFNNNNFVAPAMIIPARFVPINYTNPFGCISQPYFPSIVEYWLPITEDLVPKILPYYYISTYGRVYSTKYNKFLNCCKNGSGYNEVCLRLNDTTRKLHRVHRLMMMVFCPIVDMDNCMVNHIDGIKSHNWLWNLEWCDNTHNINEAIKLGLKLPKYGEEHPMSVISDTQARGICELLKLQIYTHQQIADMYNIHRSVVTDINTGATRKYLYHEYGLGNLEKRVCKIFTNEQLHSICQYFENHISEYETSYELYIDALLSIGIVFDRDLHRKAMATIKYKKGYNSICDQYNY